MRTHMSRMKRQPREPLATDNLVAKADSWDGPHFRVTRCGINHFTESAPTRALFMDAMEPGATWEFVLSGAIYYRNGVDRHRIDAGEALVYRHPDPGWMLRPVKDEPVRTIWLCIAGEPALRLFDHLHHKFGQIHRHPFESDVVRRAKQIVMQVLEQPERSAYFWSEQVFAFMNAWWRCMEEQQAEMKQLQLRAVKPSRMISYSPRSVTELAVEMGYSRAYLTRKLTQQWERPPGRVLREGRLQDAARLLRNTRMSVNDVSTKVGYVTSAGFCRAFKRMFKQSPAAYRHANV
jgi:AraC-like DNA-binding protein